MQAHDIGALPVWYGGQLQGIITDRDITVRAVSQGRDPNEVTVGDVMTRNVVTCYDDQTVEEAAKLMALKQIRRLVVVNRSERLTGIVTLGDLSVDTGDDELTGKVLEKISTRPIEKHNGYERILVALDGSEIAEQVLPHVEPIARKFGATVTLIRAVTLAESNLTSNIDTRSLAGGRANPAAIAPITENLRLDAVSYLQGIEHRLMYGGITVEWETPEGRPADIILQRARHLGVDLIAMTTHGRSALGRVFFGSVASAVLQAAPCPVLLVRVHQP
jgi:nucleotide-binding universal stress UspA family protein/predicted transcriptional regulator